MPQQMTFVPVKNLSKQAARLAIKALIKHRRELTPEAIAWTQHKSGSPRAAERRAEVVQAIQELEDYLREL